MASKIDITPTEIWDFFQENKERLGTVMRPIAENPEYGVEIYLTEDSGLPSIIVTADDEQVYEETAVNEHDCEKTAEKIYDTYLTEKAISVLTEEVEEDELTDLEIEDMISERENELDCAVWEFLETVLQGAYCDDCCENENFDDMLDDLKGHFLEYMARKHDLPIYRPMILEYDDGTEEMSEYPYEEMEFDDPDNPIYNA